MIATGNNAVDTDDCSVESARVAGSLGDMRPKERDAEECNGQQEILINVTGTQVFDIFTLVINSTRMPKKGKQCYAVLPC
jgi:hypothetical protein